MIGVVPAVSFLSARGPASPGPTRVRRLGLLMLAVTLTALLSGCGRPENAGDRADASAVFRGDWSEHGYTMPDTTLTDTTGTDFNLRSSPSRPVVLVYFGYSNCPDVCPQVLSDVASALQKLDPSTRQRIQVLVVTVDPARDNPKVLRAWLARFDPDFIGLTGDLGRIKHAAEQVGVDIESHRATHGGGYQVSHSAQVIGFGSDRTAHLVWNPSTSVDDLRHDFELLVRAQ